MQRFLSIIIFLLVFGVNLPAFCETIERESKVTKAIVYTDSSQITRQVEVQLKEGINEVVFSNVPENLNEGTLTVSAKGEARAKILDAKIKKIFLEKPESTLVRELEEKIQELEDKSSEFNNQQIVIREEREFLSSVKLHANQQIPKDLITKMPNAEELDSINNFLREKWQDTLVRELEIKKELRKINDRLGRLRKELAELRQARGKEKRIISVEVDVEKGGLLTVSASYLMYQASWYPEYDARVDYEERKVELVSLGIVKQTSGEDWQGIELTLSTAKPTISGRMPQLQSWILRPYRPKPLHKAKRDMLMYSVVEERGESQGADLVEEQSPSLYAQLEEKLTSVNYKIGRFVDIKSDGTKHRLPVFSEEILVKFHYSTTPKLSPFAYLACKVTNEREQLLPASVRIFLGDTYIGSSSIDAIGKGEEFDLYLGIDEGVKVKREKLKEETKEVWIAGIKRRNKVIVATYKITVENYKSKGIKINVFDHTPIPQTDQIAVKLLNIKPKPSEEDYEDRKGVMRWELSIKPKGKKEIILTYQVEHPRDMDIGL